MIPLDMQITLVTSAFSAALSFIVAYLMYQLQRNDSKRRAQMEQIERERKEEEDRRREEDKQRAEEAKAANDALNSAVQCLLRDKLIYLTQKSIDEGYKQSFVTENVGTMYDAYRNLHGNGLVKNLFEQFSRLPIKKKG